MLKQCQDSYSTQFTQFPAMLAYHEETRKASLWERTEVNRLRVAALDSFLINAIGEESYESRPFEVVTIVLLSSYESNESNSILGAIYVEY